MESLYLAGVNVSHEPACRGTKHVFYVSHGNVDECGRDTGRKTEFIKYFATKESGLAWLNEYVESLTP